MKKFPALALIALVLCAAAFGAYLFRHKLQRSGHLAANSAKGRELTILWAFWSPADNLQKLADDFTNQTGIKITIVQESWATLLSRFLGEMEKKGDGIFDMVIGDSQWLGIGATRGYYIELSKWIRQKGVDNSMTTASITGYSEYPKSSGHYWAVPVEGDAMGFAYRKDLFEDTDEKLRFKEKYGYRLTTPETWAQLRDIAEFFYRPEKDFYGVLLWNNHKYDGLTMGLDSLIWAWGADLGDQRTYKVKGILNSQAGIDALKFYKELNRFNNPEWANYYIDSTNNSKQPLVDGKVAMSMVFLATTTSLAEHSDKIGFFACPRGPEARATSLGGQGISIISYSKDKDLAFRFLNWFVRDEVQQKWSRLGGLSCNKRVMYSKEFLDAAPSNRAFVDSMEMVRDFWVVPEYGQLLAICQQHWHEFLTTDTVSARETMNTIARKWEELFESRGYYKE